VRACRVHGLVMPSRAGPGWRRGRVAQRGGEVAVAVATQDADGEICVGWPWPWGRCRCGSGRRPRRRWCRGGGATPRCPSGPASSRPDGRACLGGGEAGDRVGGHGPPPPAVKRPDAWGDPDGLGGVGESQASHGSDLQAAELHAVVAAVVCLVRHGDVWPRQSLELLVERGLVALHDQEVGGELVGDQPVGMLTLGVHGVSAVTTVAARSRRSSSGRNWVISLLGCPRRSGPGRHSWGGPSLPAGGPARDRGGRWSASHRPITRSNASGSTRASTRRTVASAGGR
jgi:hypothetical protein